MIIRLSKALLVCAIALFATLVAFGNITDYGSNFAFVRHVFMMDTISQMPPSPTVPYSLPGCIMPVTSALFSWKA